jgi:hypothetical protein
MNAERTGSGVIAWCAGLYWARDIPVTISLTWPGAPADAALFSGPSPDELAPLDGLVHMGDGFTLTVTPSNDRLYLSNFPSPPKS